MKKKYYSPQQTIVSMYQLLPIIAVSGGGQDDVNPGEPSIGGGGDQPGNPIYEGGAPEMFVNEPLED